MAGRYYRVSPEFWTDHAWNDDERLAALYILTSPHRSTEGLFRIPLTYAATDLGWTVKRFRKALARLVADEFVEYDDAASVCLIVSALKWQAPENPNQATAAIKALRQLPATPLLGRLRTLAATHSKQLSKALAEGFAEPFAEPLAEALAESPSPSPSPPRDPPSPPEGGAATISVSWVRPPAKPDGARDRDLAAHDAEVRRYATWLLPDGTDRDDANHAVRAALGALSARVPPPTNDDVLDHVRRWTDILADEVAA